MGHERCTRGRQRQGLSFAPYLLLLLLFRADGWTWVGGGGGSNSNSSGNYIWREIPWLVWVD